jgi:hypothetical protein
MALRWNIADLCPGFRHHRRRLSGRRPSPRRALGQGAQRAEPLLRGGHAGDLGLPARCRSPVTVVAHQGVDPAAHRRRAQLAGRQAFPHTGLHAAIGVHELVRALGNEELRKAVRERGQGRARACVTDHRGA